MIKLSASEISHLLVYGVRMNFPPVWLSEVVSIGKLVHSRLGYSETKIYSKFLKINQKTVLLTGMPDKVDDNFCYELKTYHSAEAREKNIRVGKIQVEIYCYITGHSRGKLVLYDIRVDKFEKEMIIHCNPQAVISYVKQALQLKKLMAEFKEKFDKIRRQEK